MESVVVADLVRGVRGISIGARMRLRLNLEQCSSIEEFGAVINVLHDDVQSQLHECLASQLSAAAASTTVVASVMSSEAAAIIREAPVIASTAEAKISEAEAVSSEAKAVSSAAEAVSSEAAVVSSEAHSGLTFVAALASASMRRAWMDSPSTITVVGARESLLLDDSPAGLRVRGRQATSLVPEGVLARRMFLTAHQRRQHASEAASDVVVGCAEVLLVRTCEREPPPPCRICLEEEEEGSFEDDATLAQVVMAAVEAASQVAAAANPSSPPVASGEVASGEDATLSVVQEDRTATGRIVRGRLLRDCCACRGSAASVHEGCLAAWLVATGKWGEHRCSECRQPYVGRGALVLARLNQRMRALEAMAAEQVAEQAIADAGGAPTTATAAEATLEAEAASLASLQAFHDAAVGEWQAGRFAEATQRFQRLIAVLEAGTPALTAAAAALGTPAALQTRDVINEQRAFLELSASHNLGLALNDAQSHLNEAAAHISRALAGFELRLGAAHPTTLKGARGGRFDRCAPSLPPPPPAGLHLLPPLPSSSLHALSHPTRPLAFLHPLPPVLLTLPRHPL